MPTIQSHLTLLVSSSAWDEASTGCENEARQINKAGYKLEPCVHDRPPLRFRMMWCLRRTCRWNWMPPAR